MVGTRNDPGLMVLSLDTIFDFINKDRSSDDVFEVSCSYLEVYNEVRNISCFTKYSIFFLALLKHVTSDCKWTQVIYDLLEKSSGHLELREDPTQGIVVAGLRSIKVFHLICCHYDTHGRTFRVLYLVSTLPSEFPY